MILLLGASGYIGRAFAGELRRRGQSFIPLTRSAFDYSRFDFLFGYLRTMKPTFLINAASCNGPSNREPLRSEREEMMAANAILPQMIARVCLLTKTPWGHVSSGEIYSGAKVLENGVYRTEIDLGRPDLKQLYEREPNRFRGFTELDEPNFSFRTAPSNFYSGSKALAEEAIAQIGNLYIWRPRLPFNEQEEQCNWLFRLRTQVSVSNQINSASHVDDFAKAALDLWQIRAPFGIYNITNPGVITTREIYGAMQRGGRAGTEIKMRRAGENSPQDSSAEPSANCILDASKLLNAGVKIRTIGEAVKDALEKMRQGGGAAKAAPPLAFAS